MPERLFFVFILRSKYLQGKLNNKKKLYLAPFTKQNNNDFAAAAACLLIIQKFDRILIVL